VREDAVDERERAEAPGHHGLSPSGAHAPRGVVI